MYLVARFALELGMIIVVSIKGVGVVTGGTLSCHGSDVMYVCR